MVLLWYGGTGTSIGNLSYTWDANKNKTSEGFGGTMSGYGFTSAGTSYDDEDRLTGNVTCSMGVPPMIKNPTHELLTAGGQSLETDPKGMDEVLSSSLTPQASQLTPVARTGTGGSVVYVQHDQQTIADNPVGCVASTPTNRYVYASYIDEPVVRKAASTSGTIHYHHRNQQYSITAMTTSTGAVAERYAYTAYGQPTILNVSGTVLTSSAVGNRYTYTGREWDETLGLHHFRARWMSPLAGRFLGRDPIGYSDGLSLYDNYFAQSDTDPSGLRKVCCKFRLGWVISQYTVKELDCESGKGADQCCQDYAYTWHRLWAVEGATDQPCVKSPYVTQKCELLTVVTTTTTITKIQTCPKPLVSIHPAVIISTALICANEAYIDDDPQIDFPPLPPNPPKPPRTTCKKDFVGWDLCSNYVFKNKRSALGVFPNGSTARGKPGNARQCGKGGGDHYNVYGRQGSGFLGSIICCNCCQDTPNGAVTDNRCNVQ